MQDGKALQAGTSHFLGQNFSKAFDVTFQSDKGVREFPWATSWGVSTRLIGGLLMTHSDDQGLVVPPRLAPLHVVICPLGKTDAEHVEFNRGRPESLPPKSELYRATNSSGSSQSASKLISNSTNRRAGGSPNTSCAASLYASSWDRKIWTSSRACWAGATGRGRTAKKWECR